MTTNQTVTELLPSLSSGMLDEFGNGNVVNNRPAMFSLPTVFASMAQDGWYITQWGQPSPVNVNNYIVNSATSYDQVYGNALYSWPVPGQTAAIALYQNTSMLGGGYVVQLTDGSTNTAPQGMTDEADMFLQSPDVPSSEANLSHPITVSLDAKIVQSITEFENPSYISTYATSGALFSSLVVSFYVQYNGAGGMPDYGGFVQIGPWDSYTTHNVSYESENITPSQTSPSAFVASILLGQGTGLPMLSADANAYPDTLTYNVNQYALTAIEANFSSFSAAQQANLFNLANWSITGFYVGLGTNNIPTAYSSTGSVTADVAHLSSTVQLSDITVTANLNETYTATNASSTPTIDPNPQISYSDTTVHASGKADGGVYDGTLANVQYEYTYNGYDSLSITAPTGANWYFGGGYGTTTLTATSGNNVFLSSLAGSIMNGGTGDDTFIIQNTNSTYQSVSNTVSHFHAGEQIVLDGLGGAGWTYSLTPTTSSTFSTSVTLLATNASLGETETVILSGLSASSIDQLSLTKVASTDDLSLNYDTSTEAIVPDLGAALATYGTSTSELSFISASFGSTGSGANTLNLSAPARVNAVEAQEITNFAKGDTLTIKNLSGPDWTCGFVDQNLVSLVNGGATLVIQNTNTGVVDLVGFDHLSPNDLASIALSWGAASSNHLTVTHL